MASHDPAGSGIRPVAAEDLDTVRTVMLAAYAEHLERVPGPVAGIFRRAVASLRADDPGYELSVADVGYGISGAVLLRFGHNGDLPWPPELASIHLLSVLPGYRARGIGRALTVSCIERARRDGYPAVALQTAELMHAARRLYEHLGFRRRPDWDRFPDGAPPALAYELTLTASP